MLTSLTDDDGGARRARVPATAAWLGGLGLVPFAALSIACLVLTSAWKTAAVNGLLTYGAVILSFLGGIHWGAAMTKSIVHPTHSVDPGRLGISVVPSLVGWAALLIDARYGLVVLAIGFVGNVLLDRRLTRQGLVPPWYPRLRQPLTMIVVATLILAEIGQVTR